VIVILGILAATALPKFANLGADARIASVNAARGAMTSAASIVHGKFLVTPASLSNGNITLDGTAIASSANGYPTATTAGILAAASISTNDYKAYVSTDSGTNIPTPAANAITLVPVSLVGTNAAMTCNVTYTMPVAANSASNVGPTVTSTTSACE
jgi:MSHA pilin protein MshA